MIIDHHYHPGLSYLNIWNFESALLEFLSVMRGLSCLYVYHNMSICVCQVSVCHSMSRWLMTFLDIMMYQSMFVCLVLQSCVSLFSMSTNFGKQTSYACYQNWEPHTSHPKKKMTSLWKRQQFYIVFLFFFEIFNVMKICSKTHFLVYKLSLCFFLWWWQLGPGFYRISHLRRYREFLPVLRRVPRGFGDTERRVEPWGRPENLRPENAKMWPSHNLEGFGDSTGHI